MKRLTLCIGILVLSVLACNFSVGLGVTPTLSPAPTLTAEPPTATKPSPPTKPAGKGPGRCGDGVCDGPENADICPQDCAPGESTTTPAGQPEPFDTYRVTNPTSGAELFVAVMHPQDWNSETLRALVVIPGGTDYSRAITDRPVGREFADAGFVVVAFDPDGRGRSTGEEDYNGFIHQDALAAVVEFMASLPGVDGGQIGMISMSYGITLASGALARYPNLPVRFLIDWEGPADRNDTGGCGGDDIGKLNPLVACDDETYWAGHEALTFISQINVPYQRIQSEVDHVQPDATHALKMVNAAVEGGVPWVRLNDLPPNQTYELDAPPAMIPEGADRQSQKLILRYAQELFDLPASGAILGETGPDSTGLGSSGPATEEITPVFVTVGTHLEEKLPLPCGENCDNRCRAEYERYRSNLITYADLFLDYGVEWNLQTNYEFLRLTDMCETDELREATTEGKSILTYLLEDKGAMIDTHAHTHSGDNYADVKHQLCLHGIPDSMLTVVGGCAVGDMEQFESFEAGLRGEDFPDVVWYPLMYTFPAIPGHNIRGEDFTSGLWKPGGFDWNPLEGRYGDLYYTHDESKRMVVVGSGFLHSCALGYETGYFYYASDYINQLVEYIEDGTAEGDKMYTATIATTQKYMNDPDTYLPIIETQLQALQDHVAAGKVVYVHYQDLLDIWAERYDRTPNVFRIEEFDVADFTCDGHGNRIP
jgi:pimeloyl-ACP methyl ester carboxylesterase